VAWLFGYVAFGPVALWPVALWLMALRHCGPVALMLCGAVACGPVALWFVAWHFGEFFEMKSLALWPGANKAQSRIFCVCFAMISDSRDLDIAMISHPCDLADSCDYCVCFASGTCVCFATEHGKEETHKH
jgi:hypothetical protein